MAGSLFRATKNRWIVSFGDKGREGSIFETFDNYKEARKFWKDNQDWKTKPKKPPPPSPEATKIKNYLTKLAPGTRIHAPSIAKELNVSYNIVDDQLYRDFPNKFIRRKTVYDLETRRAFTKDGIKFEPKFFQHKNKQGVAQNQAFYQDSSTGEWKVKRKGTKDGKRIYIIDSFKKKEDASEFYKNKKKTGGGNAGKLKRYLDNEFIKNKNKKLEFKSLKDVGTKAGVPDMLEGDVSKVLRLPKYRRTVKKFSYTKAIETPLNKSQIESIEKEFGSEKPKEGWNFKTKTNPKGSKYGVSTETPLGQRIKNSFLEQPWRYGFSVHKAPGAWMLIQMDRAAGNKDPRYESIFNKEEKVIGVKEDGISYYANRELAPSNASKLIQSHPQFEQVQKIVDIAAKANEPLIAQKDKASRAIVDLFPKGFDSSRVSLSRLLAYLYKHKGLEVTKNAINIHHIESLKRKGSPINPENLMLARRDHNMLAEAVNKMVGKKEPDISRVPELKEARVKIKVDDVFYGRGTRDPAKYISEQTKEIYGPLSKLKTKDWTILQSYLTNNYDKLIKEGNAGGPICGLKSVKNVVLGQAVGGPTGPGCGAQVKQVLQENPDQLIKEAAEAKVKSGQSTGFRNIARQILNKIPKGGRLGAIFAGTAAVGAGAAALFPTKAEAGSVDRVSETMVQEPGTTEVETIDERIDDPTAMTYNATDGTFTNLEGDPLDQTGVLNWIADHPMTSGLVAMPALYGAGLGAKALDMKRAAKYLTHWKAAIPAMALPFVMHEWKQGLDVGDIALNPVNAIWALGIGKTTGTKAFYEDRAARVLGDPKKWEQLKLFHKSILKDPGSFGRRAMAYTMSPAAKGTNLAFAKWGRKPMQAIDKRWIASLGKKGLGALAGRGVLALGAVAALPFTLAPGLLTAGLFAADFAWDQIKDYRDGKIKIDDMRARGKISEEDAENYMSLIKQGSIPFGIGNRLFGPESMRIEGQDYDPEQQRQVLKFLEEDVIDAMQEGRQKTTAKWREDDFDLFSEGGRVGMKLGGGMDRREFLKWLGALAAGTGAAIKGWWKPGAKQAVEQIAKEAIPAANPELWIPRLIAKIKAEGKLIGMADKSYVTGDKYEAIIKGQKVKMESNPVNGESQIRWETSDSFGDDMERVINFKEGEWIPPTKVGEKGTKTKADFEFVQPNQSDPYRKDIDYFDWETESDGVLDGMKEWIGVEVKESTHPPGVNIYEKFAEGGEIETGNIARRPGAVPPLSGPTPQGEGIVGLFSNPKQVSIGS